MDNANKSKVNFVLYIVLALIIVAVVCMTVFSIATGSKKHGDNSRIPNATESSTKQPEASATRGHAETQNPESTSVELPDEDVNSVPDNEPAQDVDAPVKVVFSKPVEGYLLKGCDLDMPVYSLTMNDYRVHAGIDVIADPGSPVVAAAEGTVQNIYDHPMMGNCISISHENGLVSYYMGLSEELGEGIVEGAPVYCGQLLSSVGDSTLIEIAEEPHLHFEMKLNGTNVNPSDYIYYDSATSSSYVDEYYEG